MSKSLDMKEWLLVHEERRIGNSSTRKIKLRIQVDMQVELNAEKYAKN